jgi:predicted Rossmann fold flavoprotein
VIFATGLLASPKLGSDGSAFDLIKGFGHRFTRLVPALCGFYADGIDWKKVAGVRCDACVRFFVDGESVASDTGELQLTEYGISGIPVFQVSRFASVGLAQKRRVEASIRFLPGMTGQEILDEFRFRLGRADGAVEAYDLLDGLLNQKLIPVLLDKAGLSVHSRVTEPEQAAPLAEVIQNLWLTLQKPRDYEFAQVCAGGIATEDIDTGTLMSRLVPGLFFCGELLDVDGICGGYNLQWAWSSGFVAGRGAVQS